MNIFGTSLTDERRVYISRFAPNHSGYPSAKPWVPKHDQRVDAIEYVSTVTANVEPTARVTSFTGRVDSFGIKAKSALLAGAVVKTVQSCPFTWSIYIGASGAAYVLRLPAPVLQRLSKIRIARKSAFIEVVAHIADAGSGQGLPFFMYPTYCHLERVGIYNMPSLKVERLPIVDISQTLELQWLNAHVAYQFSARERALRDQAEATKQKTHSDVRVNFKDSLFSLFMHFSGIQGRKARSFGINHPTRGGIHIIILVADLRVDLANHTVVLDSVVLPLTAEIMPKISGFLASLTDLGVCSISVDDDELQLWREVLPAFVERCREWEHRSSCEYIEFDRIPLSTSDGQPILCSCGHGKFPSNFVSEIPGWNVARKYTVRAAISPCFSVPYIEPSIDVMNNLENPGNPIDEGSGSRRCRTCQKGELPGGAKLMKCSRCSRAWYCSSTCQRADYFKHRGPCRLTQT